MAGLGSFIQEYDTTPLLRQQQNDALLHSRMQESQLEAYVKQQKMLYDAQKDQEKRYMDAMGDINKLVTSGNLRKEISNDVLANGLPRVMDAMGKQGALAGMSEATKVIGDAVSWNKVTQDVEKEAQVAASAYPRVNKDVFAAEYTKRKLYDQYGNLKPLEQIQNDKNDYAKDVLYNADAPLYSGAIKAIDIPGARKQKISIKTDQGVKSVENTFEANMPNAMTFDRVRNEFDVIRGKDGQVADYIYNANVREVPDKDAYYDRLARAQGPIKLGTPAEMDAELTKRKKKLFERDVLAQATTDFSEANKENVSDNWYMHAIGMIGDSARKNKEKDNAINPIAVIGGALSKDGTYVQGMDIVPGIDGYKKPLIDITPSMPNMGGLIVGRDKGKAVKADKVYVDPDAKSIIVQQNGIETPVVYSGMKARNFLTSLGGYNGVKDGESYVNNIFDKKGNFILSDDPEGAAFVNEQSRAAKAADLAQVHAALDNYQYDKNISTLAKAIKGRTITMRELDGSLITGTIQNIKVQGGDWYIKLDKYPREKMMKGIKDIDHLVSNFKRYIR